MPARPGALQHLSIEVRRPGLEVVPSSMRFRQAGPGELVDRSPASGLLDAFASPLAMGGLPLRMAALPIGLPNQRDQALIVTLGLNAPTGDEPARTYTVRTSVFDGEGRREILQRELSLTVSSGTASELEVVQQLTLRPGRYNVRTYVQRSGTTEVGSVFLQTTVPDFAREPLSMSGIAVGRAGGRAVAGRETVADVLPFAPTAQRTFFPTDKVGALWRVYATSGDALAVTQTVQILDSRGTAILTEDLTLPSSAFSGDAARAGVEQRLELPLSSLPAGNYLLRVVTSSGSTRAQRDVRFDVDRGRAPLP